MSETRMTTTAREMAVNTYDEGGRLGPCMASAGTGARGQFSSRSLRCRLHGTPTRPRSPATRAVRTPWKAVQGGLAHDERVQAAILEEGRKLIRDTSAMAIGVIEQIASDPKVDPKDRLKAAVELLNRSGFSAVSEHKVTVEKDLSYEALVERIKVLAAKRGIDPDLLLGRAAPRITDARFEVVGKPSGSDAPAEPEPVK